MAMRRGDLKAAAEPLTAMREIASAAGEPQRILPMAAVMMPYAALTNAHASLRELVATVLATTGREWAQLTTTPIPRALAAAGETELLRQAAEAFRLKTRDIDAPRIAISATVAEGHVALVAGDADAAVESFRAAAERERGLGWTYRAACLDLDLADALGAAGRPADATEARDRAAAVLEPLGCVNAY